VLLVARWMGVVRSPTGNRMEPAMGLKLGEERRKKEDIQQQQQQQQQDSDEKRTAKFWTGAALETECGNSSGRFGIAFVRSRFFPSVRRRFGVVTDQRGIGCSERGKEGVSPSRAEQCSRDIRSKEMAGGEAPKGNGGKVLTTMFCNPGSSDRGSAVGVRLCTWYG
jgi:hypothetical protein